jgi:predicted DNA-binding transcriptional regulator YafY
MAPRAKRHPKLLELIALGDGEVDVDSLAVALKVSSKTVRRDLNELRSLGFTIREYGASRSPKKLSLDGQLLSQFKLTYDEAFVLMLYRLGNSSFESTFFGEAAASAFAKFDGVIGPVEKEYLKRMLPRVRRNSVGGDYSKHSEIVEGMTLAVEDAKVVEITYCSASRKEPLTYDIEPYGLVEHRGTLYVVGNSERHREIRVWKVDRMVAAKVTGRSFRLPNDFNINEYFGGAFAVVRGDTAFSVAIRFTGSAVRYVQEKRMHPSQRVEVQPDGSAIAHFELNSTFEIRSWVLSFGPAAEVLSPECLRDEVRELIGQMLCQYERDKPVTDQCDCPSR